MGVRLPVSRDIDHLTGPDPIGVLREHEVLSHRHVFEGQRRRTNLFAVDGHRNPLGVRRDRQLTRPVAAEGALDALVELVVCLAGRFVDRLIRAHGQRTHQRDAGHLLVSALEVRLRQLERRVGNGAEVVDLADVRPVERQRALQGLDRRRIVVDDVEADATLILVLRLRQRRISRAVPVWLLRLGDEIDAYRVELLFDVIVDPSRDGGADAGSERGKVDVEDVGSPRNRPPADGTRQRRKRDQGERDHGTDHEAIEGRGGAVHRRSALKQCGVAAS